MISKADETFLIGKTNKALKGDEAFTSDFSKVEGKVAALFSPEQISLYMRDGHLDTAELSQIVSRMGAKDLTPEQRLAIEQAVIGAFKGIQVTEADLKPKTPDNTPSVGGGKSMGQDR